MNAAKIRLKRKTVKKEVQNHYDHDKDFFLSFLKSYIVEALCDFFGIEEITDRPTVNVPDDPNDTNCVQSKMDEFIDKYVFAVGTDATSVNVQETEVLTVTPLELLLPNGHNDLNISKRKFIAVCHISNVIGYKLSNLSFSVAQPDLRPFAPVNLSRVSK
jgi:hypothetical protein